MTYKIRKIDIPRQLKSTNKNAAFKPEVARWCQSQGIQYHLVWDEYGGGYYKTSRGWQRGRLLVGVEFKNEEDVMAFKLRWC